MDEPTKGTRRRGEMLVEAILHATMEELAEIGYTHLTMESVATRAGTNKAVLYRRWANKSELVMAALRQNMPKLSTEIPNTGDLREDVVTYLLEIMKPLRAIGPQTIRGLMMEPAVMSSIISAMPHVVHAREEGKLTVAMRGILQNAELRGEVCLKRLTPRIISLPIDLLRLELVTTQEITDATIREIVDDMFLPLVRLNPPSAKP